MDGIRDLLTDICLVGAAVSVRAGSPEGEVVDLPYEWYGYSGDVESMDFYVTNNDPSRAGESVTFELVFDGDVEGYDSDTEKAEAHRDLYRWYKIVYP